MWQMKEWFFKVVLQTLWRRRKGLYYALTVASIAGNLIVFVGPSLQASTVLRNIEALQVAWISALPQVAEVILHRFVLNILLNLIVARIVVKSGVLGQTTGMPVMKQLDDFCLPLSSSSYSLRGGFHWPAMQAPSPAQLSADPSKPLPCLDHGDVKPMSVASTEQAVYVLGHVQTRARPQTSFMKRCDDENTKCTALAPPSLFTIEPLEELVRSAESFPSLLDDQAHSPKSLQHPLRKVMSRAMDLHRSTEERWEDSVKPKQLQQQEREQSLEVVSQDVDRAADDGNDAAEHDDNRLSRQEFNERVSNFIVKFKRNLTMQRQDSLTRLLGLVGGGGDIRLFK